MAGTDVETHAAPGNESSFPVPGVVLLAPDRTVAFATAHALRMLAIAADGASALQACVQRLGNALNSLPGDVTRTSRIPFEFTDERGRHRLRASAHALPSGGWLLQIEDRDQLESQPLMLSDSVRAQLWKRLRPVLHHDFKAPVQSILWSLEILERAPPGREGEIRKRDALEVIRKETHALQERLQSLLDEIAPLEAEPALVDAGELLQRAAHLIRSECGLYGVDAEVVVAEAGLRVEAHADDLRLAVLTLLFIVLDRLREGGRLALAARRAGSSIELTIEGRSNANGKQVQVDRADILSRTDYQVAGHITRDHGGRLAIADRSPICFVMTLPAHAQADAGS